MNPWESDVLLVHPSLAAICLCCEKQALVAWRTSVDVAPYFFYCLRCWRHIDAVVRLVEQ